MKDDKLIFFKPDADASLELQVVEGGISAGFPSPAEDFKETTIDLNKALIKNKEATFYARVSGQSMTGAGLDDGDLLIIDKSIEPVNGKIAVCFIEGEFTVKRLKIEKGELFLMPENKRYKPIKVEENDELIIWGIVTYVIKSL
ncbi:MULTISPECIES: LexA family protein [Galbibacter]|uniref:SOS response transcriptional repressor, RecA-mediated autopeptidase n=1 Tax=Galbibacter orientalis DSM 19592 TaxID=926559 RepID=I3C3W6_9FLAO|nr:translesion error-prone DNA polymerase V autoproteolytic subunit [Galbibacter orientalis]EIJ38309.1 SOS response transcriptional repressor, RecA-mediated autopeptidase [Galbibacter orientalis DSM 19592]|tara:strand:+ start:184 stop:615 length:432 start_codon:yes stop_codon:yes gene_type:complete